MDKSEHIFIESIAVGINRDQFDRYNEYLEGLGELDDSLDIIDWLDNEGEEYKHWFYEEASYEELFSYDVITGQNGNDIKELLRGCWGNGDFYINVFYY
jgi:hypothetical protein